MHNPLGKKTPLDSIFDHRPSDRINFELQNTSWSLFLSEIFSNSGHFLILKTFADLILYGFVKYITDPTEYLLILVMGIQAWYLSRPQSHRFLGNLIGVTLYTMIDFTIDGWEFWENPIHLVFWAFSILIATLQGCRYHWLTQYDFIILPLESLVRTFMVAAFYLVLNFPDFSDSNYFIKIHNTLNNKPHIFLICSLMFIGLLLGLQAWQIHKQQHQLQNTAHLLGKIAKWGLGSYMVKTAFNNPDALAFQKCERTILFMDIRGFTAWCEQTPPDVVAMILNDYYCQVEPAAAQYDPLRISLTADEIMAIYTTPQQAVAAAQAMQKAAIQLLTTHGLGAGCGIHGGSVIEGLFGGDAVRTYTVIGDVVNTAKRIESATPSGEIIISDTVYQGMLGQLKVEPYQPIVAKGKQTALQVWRLIF